MLSDTSYTPQPQDAAVMTNFRRLTIGLPSCCDAGERRFPLTPEAVAVLTDAGYGVRIQEGAARVIHYTDAAYVKAGAEIGSREDALSCDIVIALAPLSDSDIRKMRRGSMLLSLLNESRQSPQSVNRLLDRHIIAVAIDLITDRRGNTPFYDILSEIDGRAAVALSASLLADPLHGKGILLGGVAGIVPCEVTVIGSGIAACAAASSALGAGAMVRMFDNDVYRLREASRSVPGIITSALHPHVVANALRSADVVIATEMPLSCRIDADMVDVMKKGVVIMDLNHDRSPMFPSLPEADVSSSPVDIGSGRRVCYTGISNAVPRTSAMALSNTFLSLMHDILSCEGIINTVKMRPGLQCAVYTFHGKAVNRRIARIAGVRAMDMSLLLSCS